VLKPQLVILTAFRVRDALVICNQYQEIVDIKGYKFIEGHGSKLLCLPHPRARRQWRATEVHCAVETALQSVGGHLLCPAGETPSQDSGSPNFKTKYAPAFPTVEITHAAPGKITTAAELESAGLVAPAEESPARALLRVSPAKENVETYALATATNAAAAVARREGQVKPPAAPGTTRQP
jgi:hypothetical protein